MLEKEKIALLWLIRQHPGGIKAWALLDLMRAGQLNLPVEIPLFSYTSAFERGVERHVGELLEYGLLNTADGGPYRSDAKLVVSPLLGRVQDMFGISLTDSLMRSPSALMVDPVFPQPKAKSPASAGIFVAMPFASELKPIYTDHILKVTGQLGLTCRRGDDFFTTNHIMQDVWSAIYQSELCIVDCTGRNPNVFYELGIAHTLGRKTILIVQSLDDIPFDLKAFRVIDYLYTPPGMVEFETRLTKTLQEELGL